MMDVGRPETASREGGARARILKSAGELFYQHGIQGVGIDRIITHAGVARMSLYNHFKSKDELVSAWLRETTTGWHSWVRGRLAERRQRGEEPLAALFGALAEWFAREDFRGCPFVNICGEAPADQSEPRRLAQEHTLAIRALVAECCPGLTEGGVLAVTLLIEGAVVWASIHGRPGAEAALASAFKASARIA